MARYIDGFVFSVPRKNLAAYKALAKKAGKVWREHGALEYLECMSDDVVEGVVPFTKLARAKPDEVVFFSFIIFKSRAHRNTVNAKVMKDPRMQKAPKPSPFDPKRMAYGGFKALVDMK